MVFNYLRAVKILPVFLSFELFLSLNFLPPVQAQPLSETEETVEEVIRTRVNFQPPSDTVPNADGSGGSRGYLTLLLPTTPQSMGLTTKANPTFFIYIAKTQIHEVDFILQDLETQEILYETKISLSGNPGVIGIRLPADAPLLEVGKVYVWGIVSELTIANGTIKRVERPSLNSQLESAEALEKAVLYAENGIWFDTLEVLAKLKRSQPNNETYAREWTKLLNSVGLDEEIVKKPLVD